MRPLVLWLAACAGAPEAPEGSDPPEPVDTVVVEAPCVTDDAFFADVVVPVLADCETCHVADGAAAQARWTLVPGDDVANRTALRDFVAIEGTLLLDKPSGRVSHGGGVRISPDTAAYEALREFVARALAPGGCEDPGDPVAGCGPELHAAPVSPRRLTDRQLRHAVEDLFGVRLGDGVFPPTVRGPDFRTFASSNPVTAPDAEQLMIAAETVAAQVDLTEIVRCLDPEACAREALLDWGTRAFRRPLTSREADVLTRFVDAGLPPTEAVQLGLMVLLQSPQFLYVDVVPEETALLTDHAIAARLALFLTDSLPDAELRAVADAGALHTREQVADQARRLVADARAVRAVRGFHDDWLDSYRLDAAERDPGRYPGFSDATRQSLHTELDLVVSEVVWSGSARFEDLLFTQTTWVDSEVARIYGLPDPGPGWHRVDLGPERPGVLTRAGFLACHAYAAASSPVQRGAFVVHELFCEDLEPPQDVNMDLPPESEVATTIRERLAQHAADPTCAGCHDRMDPMGFAFEHFDAEGAWRDQWESGLDVDATGSLEDPAGDFDGAAEMMGLVATSPRAQACYAQRWYEYALGHPAGPEDRCSLAAVQARFEATGGDLRSLLVDLAITDAFRGQIEEVPE